ncbi:MAG: hypothetical protein NUW01_09435 [Gemmatimonadaceae bacterium]|nr:hypothetical protein [Gemmatimonadaceae bacterium]
MGVYRIRWRRLAQLRRAWIPGALIPINTVAPVASGTPEVAEVLSCTTGTWTNSPTSYTYQWQRDNSGGGTYSDIAAATSSTYVLVSADTDCNVRCQVTAHNTVGASYPAASNALGLVTARYYELGSDLPAVLIEIDFDHDPTSTSFTWTDVTAYVREFSLHRGRPDTLSQPAPGTLALTLKNTDDRFTPTNTAGAYYPNVLPMRRIRVRAKWNSVAYNLFTGYVEDWPLSFPDMNRNALVTVQASDAFAVLNLTDLGGQSYAAQLSSARATAVFGFAGFNTWNASTGQDTIVASGTIAYGTMALPHVQDVAQSESGLVYADAGGTLRFQDRQYRFTNNATSVGTVGTGGGMIGYQDLTTSYGVSNLWNSIRVTANGGTAETATDASSTASYYKRTLDWPPGGSYLVASQAVALSAAQAILASYKNPALRVPEVVTVPAGATANWPTVLALDLSDRMTLSHITPGGGTILGSKHVEGVTHDVSFERTWDATLALSDATSAGVWVLGNATYSLLGESTILSY